MGILPSYPYFLLKRSNDYNQLGVAIFRVQSHLNIRNSNTIWVSFILSNT